MLPAWLTKRAPWLSQVTEMRDAADATDDAELVAAVRRGDAAAADRLVRRHFRSAWAVALALLGNESDAEDVCQDAFVRALERIEECRRPDRFAYWLLQIVRNRSHNARDYRRVRSGPSLEEIEAAAPGDATRDTETHQLSDRLLAALDTLTPVQRQVVLLKDLEDWDHRAIAKSLGISEGASRQQLFAARRALRERLGPAALEDHLHDR
jgi:RNA polymerase sigma-70 factor, ECF subfamily